MKAEELMIGDWVIIHNSVYKIKELSEYYVGYYPECDPVRIFKTGFDDICGIPITPEILEKNGFIRSNDFGYPEHYNYKLPSESMVFNLFALNDSDFSFNINGCAMNINYVHELQHVLRLCKIDKEIEL